MSPVQPPEVWQPWQHGGSDVSPGRALADWIARTASVYVYLANDAGTTVMFSQTQPADGNQGSSAAAAAPPGAASQPGPAEEDAAATEHRAIEAKGRQWVRSPLQVPMWCRPCLHGSGYLDPPCDTHVTGACVSHRPGN
jgi:hypothetical protein